MMRALLLCLLLSWVAHAQGRPTVRVSAAASSATSPPLVLRGAQGVSANSVTIPAGKPFCVSAFLRAAGGDWTGLDQPRGVAMLGTTLAQANSAVLYITSNNSAAAVWGRVYDSGGTGREAIATYALSRDRHQVAVCYVPTGGVFVYVDGVQKASLAGTYSLTPRATLRVADLGAGVFPYGTGVEDVCVAGASGVSSALPAVAIANTCGQFTTYAANVPCRGCVEPLAGAVKWVALGDSITEKNLDTFRTMPQRLNALLGVGYSVTNGGVSGNTCAQVRARYQSTYKGQGFVGATVLCGINDILGGADAATTWASLEGLLDELRTDGLQVVPVRLLPFAGYATWSAGKQSVADSVNASLASWCTTHGKTCVSGASLGDGGSPAQLTTANHAGDWLHLSQAGSDGLAGLLSAAVRP